LVPLLPIPNRTVKRLSADDSAGSRVKVGHCQAITALKSLHSIEWGLLFLYAYLVGVDHVFTLKDASTALCELMD
jgi:hypothetical protein